MTAFQTIELNKDARGVATLWLNRADKHNAFDARVIAELNAALAEVGDDASIRFLVLRGRGHCLVGTEVRPVETRDLVTVPPMAWHQFRATAGEPLGFLCMVNASRDKPQLPSADDLEQLGADAKVAAFLRNEPQAG